MATATGISDHVLEIEAALRSGVTPLFLVGLVALAQRDPKAVMRDIEEAGARSYAEAERKAEKGIGTTKGLVKLLNWEIAQVKSKFKLRPVALLAVLAVGLAFAPAVHAQAGTETLTVIDSSCVTAAPCTLQLYKATLAAGVNSCPVAGAAGYTALTTSQLGNLVGTVNTAWTYVDSAVAAGVNYCYYATVTSTAGGAASPPSTPFLAAIPIPAPTSAPTITGSFQPAT